jgi:mannose PTS system EIIA component
MVPALVICHGELGAAFMDALGGIFGPVEDFQVISNRGLSAEALENAVAAKMSEMGQEAIIFTDYFGGSCANASLSALKGRPGYRVVSGVNLPMLIYYLTHRSEMDMDAILPGIINRGQNAIRELMPPGL